MKIDNKLWREQEAIKHVLNNSNWKESQHEYLTIDQIEEILSEMLEESKRIYEKRLLVDKFRKRL